MSRTVRQAKQFLLVLTGLSKVQQKFLLKTATSNHVHALRELAVNLLEGNIPIGSINLGKLRKHKTFLRTFAQKTLGRNTLEKYSHVIVLILKLIRPFLESL